MTIDVLVVFTTSFITTFTTAAIGRVVGYGNKRVSGFVATVEYIFTLIYGCFVALVFIPLRVPLMRLLGMSKDQIESSKYYYIIEFCLCNSLLLLFIYYSFKIFYYYCCCCFLFVFLFVCLFKIYFFKY